METISCRKMRELSMLAKVWTLSNRLLTIGTRRVPISCAETGTVDKSSRTIANIAFVEVGARTA